MLSRLLRGIEKKPEARACRCVNKLRGLQQCIATEASHRRQSTRRPTADKTLEVVLVCIANVAAIRVGLPVSIPSLLNSKSSTAVHLVG